MSAELAAATQELIDAARAADPDAIRRAIERREQCVRELAGLETGARSAEIERLAAEAGSALREAALAAAGELIKLRQAAPALRSYATASSGCRLDRST